MKGERKLKATITTGEISAEEYDRVIYAIGTVLAIKSLQINIVKIKHPKEGPSYPEIPQELLVCLGTMGVEEFYDAIAALGMDSEWATRLWNNLSSSGVIDKPGNEGNEDQLYGYLRIKNMTKNNKNEWTGHVTREEASKLGYNIDLVALAEILNSGEINDVNNVGIKTVGFYHDIVQHRIGQILSEAQTNGD